MGIDCRSNRCTLAQGCCFQTSSNDSVCVTSEDCSVLSVDNAFYRCTLPSDCPATNTCCAGSAGSYCKPGACAAANGESHVCNPNDVPTTCSGGLLCRSNGFRPVWTCR